MFFVVDGLDQCSSTHRAELCDFLATTVERSKEVVKFFVTSRTVDKVFLQKPFPRIELNADRLASELKRYVTSQIEKRLNNCSLLLQDQNLKGKIFDALTTGCGTTYVFQPLHYDYFSNLKSNPNSFIGSIGLICNWKKYRGR